MDPRIIGLPLSMTFALGLLVFGALWLIQVRHRDAGIVDYWWGTGFAAIAWIEAGFAPVIGPMQVFVTAAVTLWAARLTVHLVRRNHLSGVEDARYAAMRARGGPDWGRRNLFSVFWLQAIVQWLLAAPIHAAMLLGATTPGSGPGLVAFAAGAVLFVAGFLIEAVSDAQLAAFKRRPGSRGRLLTTGLRAWCRHPSYFGEILVWVGIGLVAASAGHWWVLIAPAALALLLLRVSGIPLLEAHLESRPGWAAYRAATGAILPRPPRSEAPVAGGRFDG